MENWSLARLCTSSAIRTANSSSTGHGRAHTSGSVLDYYPKLLGAIPYSPVNGARLLVGAGRQSGALRKQLIAAIVAETERLGMSSAHINFVDAGDALALDKADWIARFDWQFHWTNRSADHGGWGDFDDFSRCAELEETQEHPAGTQPSRACRRRLRTAPRGRTRCRRMACRPPVVSAHVLPSAAIIRH